ncbi:MAG: hypothetical protein MZW92_36780 [Comamonadaceae bacterium]|nr:hypothetical protein [Comamonadaceae bacterium]
MQTVTFDERGPVAQALLTYGQSAPIRPRRTPPTSCGCSRASSGRRCRSTPTRRGTRARRRAAARLTAR